MLFVHAVVAANLPEDEKAYTKVDLQHVLSQAKASHEKVLLVAGANWCPDCRELDKARHRSSAPMLNGNFVLIKIDIGNFDKNLNITQFYSNPITKDILAAVVLGVDNNILYSTKAGKLANVRRMGENGIYDFVIKVMTAPQ